MTENHKQKGVLERVFAVSPKGKGLLAASCIASVLGMVLSLMPYLSVYFICKYFLLGAAGEHGGIVLWTAVAGGAIGFLFSDAGIRRRQSANDYDGGDAVFRKDDGRLFGICAGYG